MTRKKFIKLAMATGCNKRTAVWAAEYCRITYGSYAKAWDELHHWVGGRFDDCINMDLKQFANK